jgi:hypothetical protein
MLLTILTGAVVGAVSDYLSYRSFTANFSPTTPFDVKKFGIHVGVGAGIGLLVGLISFF